MDNGVYVCRVPKLPFQFWYAMINLWACGTGEHLRNSCLSLRSKWFFELHFFFFFKSNLCAQRGARAHDL